MTAQERLQFILSDRGMNIRTMSSLSELPYTTVYDYIKNGNEPSYKNFNKIVEATGYTIQINDTGESDEN
jgi:predicted transcriptional regulator